MEAKKANKVCPENVRPPCADKVQRQHNRQVFSFSFNTTSAASNPAFTFNVSNVVSKRMISTAVNKSLDLLLSGIIQIL